MASTTKCTHSSWASALFASVPEDAIPSDIRIGTVTEAGAFVDVWRIPRGDAAIHNSLSIVVCLDVFDDSIFEPARVLMGGFCTSQDAPKVLMLLPRPCPPAGPLVEFKERLQRMLDAGFDTGLPFPSAGYALALQVHAQVTAMELRIDEGLRVCQHRRLIAYEHAKVRYLVDSTMWQYLPAKITRMIPPMSDDLHPERLSNSVAGFTFVKRLGGGYYGQVHAAVATPVYEAGVAQRTPPMPTDAIKVVDKSSLIGMREIKLLHHMITVHNLLSSPRLQHPGIAMLRHVYHSPTHLFFRMEYAGPESLYSRLAASQAQWFKPQQQKQYHHQQQKQPPRAPGAATIMPADVGAVIGGGVASYPQATSPAAADGAGTQPPMNQQPVDWQDAAASAASGRSPARMRPITTEALRSVMEQAASAVAHLHLNVGACHRDIKLENFVVAAGTTGPDDIPRIKLVDFDFARIVVPAAQAPAVGMNDAHRPRARTRCRAKCGTVPYVAPEVVLDSAYDALPADMWSLGVLFLEILCGVRVVEKRFGIDHKVQFTGGDGLETIVEAIRTAFHEDGFASRYAWENVREEARPLFDGANSVGGVLDGMLRSIPERRWDIAQVLNALHTIMGRAIAL